MSDHSSMQPGWQEGAQVFILVCGVMRPAMLRYTARPSL